MQKKLLNGILILIIPYMLVPALISCSSNEEGLPSQKEVREIIIRVNDNWQSVHPEHGNAFWHQAAYHTGNMAAYQVTGLDRYLDYSMEWAEKNEWKGARSDDTASWKYRYGETDDYVLFGDWQICFQTYIDLYHIVEPGDSVRILRALEVMQYQVGTPRSDYWWWVDGLYMVMPVMTKLYKLTGDELYLVKLYEYFSYTSSIMYDREEGLFFRDSKYLYPGHTTLNGKKDFWARGNGWAFAGLAKIIPDLPEDFQYREYFIQVYKEMAGTLKARQTEEGYWSKSILDPEHAPGAESSGTSFITFGLLRGVNMDLLPADEYMPVITGAWDFLVKRAIDEEGNLGFVQPIGERAIPGQVVEANSRSDFGTGAFLLAASEMYRLTKHIQ
jgi:rhamnogalacturonyl hydrolase YesR